MVDGYNGFIMLDKNDSPKAALHSENEMRWAKKYQKRHPDKPLPHITPYVFRHTCCTNMNFILLGIAEFMLAGILAAGTFALALVSKDTEEFVDKTISNRYEKHVNSIYRTGCGKRHKNNVKGVGLITRLPVFFCACRSQFHVGFSGVRRRL